MWVWIAATAALAVLATLLWRGSDAAATTSTTAAVPAPLTGAPAPTLAQAWTAPGAPIPARPVERERVVVGSGHGVAGLDPLTGRPAWSYTRSNARLCGLTAVDGLAVAVFQVPHETGRCDQAVALDAATGVRMWTRNVDFRPDVRLTSAPGTVLAVSTTGLVAIDPQGDNERWRWRVPGGCAIADAVAGSTGVAVVQRCGGDPTVRVVLLDSSAGNARWTADLPAPAGTPLSLAGADGPVAVVVGDGLHLLGAHDGHPLPTLPLPAGGTGTASAVGDGSALVVWARGTAYSLDPNSAAVRWQRPAAGLPALVPGAGDVLVPEDGAFVERNAVSGAERRRSTVAALPAGGRTRLAGPVVVYRLPDRVVAYR